jgi:carbohydrate diacid regulator
MIYFKEELAQSIVDRMMNAIPYNVNIMNQEGIIIGSGDKERIGKRHEGAARAIAENRLIAVYESAGGTKPGVNMPIHFNNEIMGVIGISGNPQIVEAFVSIVKATAELLINQEYIFNEKRVNEKIREEFLYQWAYLNEEYDETFLQRAANLNIDLTVKRLAVIIKTSKEKAEFDKITRYLQENEYAVRMNPENILIFMKHDKKTMKRINFIYQELSGPVKIGVGLYEKIMMKSMEQALSAVSIMEKLTMPKDICNYHEISFIDVLWRNINKESFSSITGKLEETKALNLIETLTTYILFNGEVKLTSEFLHIHRNSLNYRLKRIEEITGKDPRRIIDLFELFAACILHKLD